MCTNFVLIKRSGTAALANKLGVSDSAFIENPNAKPGSLISIVVDKDGHQVLSSIWWLYLERGANGFKPNSRFFSVNTNYAKLTQKREYRESRCIVPVTAFVESQGGKSPHLIEPADGSAMAFGGLFKQWQDSKTGEMVFSASIITLPGHPKLEGIHRKSMPLWLPDDALNDWLDSSQTNTRKFSELLLPKIQKPLLVTPINKTFSKQAIGSSFEIEAD